MTLHLIFSSIGLKFFVYLLGASTDTHCFKTMVCENNSWLSPHILSNWVLTIFSSSTNTSKLVLMVALGLKSFCQQCSFVYPSPPQKNTLNHHFQSYVNLHISNILVWQWHTLDIHWPSDPLHDIFGNH